MATMHVLHLDHLQHEATTRGHAVILDEPKDVGGADTGMTPYEMLLAGLGGCIAMTLRLYAKRKNWPLEDVKVTLRHERVHAKDCDECEQSEGMLDVIRRKVELSGDLTPEQQRRLQEIASRCPVHRSLTRSIEVINDDSLV